MITYKVNKGEVLNLSEEDELFITKSIGEVILKNDIKCLAYNKTRDHVHILLVCEDKELPEFIRKIKGKSSQKFKEYLNIPKEEVFHLWAQKYDAKEIDSDKRLYNTIEYINNNRIKHELPENNGLKPIILSFLCGQNAEVCNYTDEYNDTNGRNNAKAHNGLQPIANDNAGIQKQGVVTPCYDNANNSKKLNEISKIESYYMDTYKTTEEHNGEKQTDNIENTYEEKAHIENALNMEIECKRQTYNIDIARKRQTYNIDIAHNGLQPIVVRVQDAINKAFNQYEDGGFDIVIGNPPYGAELMDIERDYLERKYSLNNTNTAALFIGLSKHLLKDKGVNGFIIPKSFIYASNWESSRELIINDLQELVDCGKVWKEVKLEQVIIMFCNNSEVETYKASERNENNIITVGKIDKKTFREFGFYLNAVSNEELNIAYKMISSKKTVNDYCINKLEGNYQNKIIEKYNKGALKVLGGKNINRYYYPNTIKGFLDKKYIKNNKGVIRENSILAQNIVAHIMNPTPHIKIIAMLSNTIENKDKYILVNTINQLDNISDLNSKFILAILNSKLISWFTYIFVFGKAIRTMHFDNPATSRIPMPSVDLIKKSDKEVHDKLVKLVDNIIAINKKLVGENNPNTKEILERQVRALDGEIDKLVYGLYGLSDNEIRIIENVS